MDEPIVPSRPISLEEKAIVEEPVVCWGCLVVQDGYVLTHLAESKRESRLRPKSIPIGISMSRQNDGLTVPQVFCGEVQFSLN